MHNLFIANNIYEPPHLEFSLKFLAFLKHLVWKHIFLSEMDLIVGNSYYPVQWNIWSNTALLYTMKIKFRPYTSYMFCEITVLFKWCFKFSRTCVKPHKMNMSNDRIYLILLAYIGGYFIGGYNQHVTVFLVAIFLF